MKQYMIVPSPFWKSLSVFLLGGVAVLALSGCAEEEKLSSSQSSLLQDPALNAQLERDDFSFPSRPPRLSLGKQVFTQNCATCHTAGSISFDKIRDARPIDEYLLLSRGDHGHPKFRNITRDQRWQAVFYYRYLGGEANTQNKDIAAVFGSNCAVCHGAKGFADGPLYSGHASAHELGMAPVKGAFDPPPANFHSYSRMYERTDTQLVKFITEGVYPSAMPSWKGREDKDKGVVFDDALILDLVKYVRAFSYENDLPEEEAKGPLAAPQGAQQKSGKTLTQSLPALENRIR